MRVFYEEENEVKRRYYVKIDNVNVPEHLKRYIAIDALSTNELKSLIMDKYGFNRNFKIELWSNSNYAGIRLDNLNEIPKEIEFIWVRGVVNKVE